MAISADNVALIKATSLEQNAAQIAAKVCQDEAAAKDLAKALQEFAKNCDKPEELDACVKAVKPELLGESLMEALKDVLGAKDDVMAAWKEGIDCWTAMCKA